MILRDCNGVMFICKLVHSSDGVYLSNGWKVFLQHGGVVLGDYISFEIKDVDETIATVFKADGKQRKPALRQGKLSP